MEMMKVLLVKDDSPKKAERMLKGYCVVVVEAGVDEEEERKKRKSWKTGGRVYR